MIKINIICNNQANYKFVKNSNNFIQRKIYYINKHFKKYQKNLIYCTLLLSGDYEIKKLNKKFRKKNKSTDVLSFPFYKKKELKIKLKKEKEIYLGDIIVNLEKIKIKENANFNLEFNKLWIHGLVHLFGYDHKKDKEFNKMADVEKQFLSYLN